MTANELADDAKNISNTIEALEWVQKVVPMLRQQQAEIEQLRKIVEDTIGQAFYEDDYHKAKAEIEQLKALIISLSPNSNLIYTRSEK